MGRDIVGAIIGGSPKESFIDSIILVPVDGDTPEVSAAECT